jgi:DNA-binding Lrp family transcriptional regulator
MEQLDRSILEILENDARTAPKDIAVMLGCEEQAVCSAISRLEADKVLLKYTTVVDNEKCGLDDEGVLALIEVRVTPQRDFGFDSVATRIARFEEVTTMYLMSGAYDLMVIVNGSSLREVSQFVAKKLSTIEGVLGTATHFILKKYKDRGVYFEQEDYDNRLKVTP